MNYHDYVTDDAHTDSRARPRVQTASRVIRILTAVAESENGLTTRELSDQLGIGRQALYHLLHTLTASGALTRTSANRIVLGLGMVTIARGLERQLSPSEHLDPLVRKIASMTGETAYAAGWRNGEVHVLAVASGTGPVRAAETPLGYVGHAHARASGKLLLAVARPELREEYFRTHDLDPCTPHTKTSVEDLTAEFEQIKRQGFSLDEEEFAVGLSCVAIPLDASSAPLVAAVSAPTQHFRENLDRNLEVLQTVARGSEPMSR
ncbi:IclR family transcriptional regulator [Prauserella endophytica]|uniref:IclR family transcriptional regulator n=2 Tax=Prauserella endophytica TaxID=1592324 RepID=A0ABY2S8A1_9PSEU|nr:IclR family transcriptional regulator [Prauserella endophytica]